MWYKQKQLSRGILYSVGFRPTIFIKSMCFKYLRTPGTTVKGCWFLCKSNVWESGAFVKNRKLWGHLLSTYAKFSEKLTFLTPYQSAARNVSFSQNFAHVLNGWTLFQIFRNRKFCENGILSDNSNHFFLANFTDRIVEQNLTSFLCLPTWHWNIRRRGGTYNFTVTFWCFN